MPLAISSLKAGLIPASIQEPKEWSKKVGKIQNPVKKSIRQQVIIPFSLAARKKPVMLIE